VAPIDLPPLEHEIWTVETEAGAAATAADFIAGVIRETVAVRGRFTMAVSGGRTPWPMFEHLAVLDLPWADVVVYQVDERVAPAGDPDRNFAHLEERFGHLPVELRPMPVEDDDLRAAAARYAADLPDRFDLIHLGIGPDGHTASLVPGDSVLQVTDRPVAVTGGTYQGRPRMTLTYAGLERTDQLLWLVAGADKAEALAGILAGDDAYPAAAVRAPRSLIVTDRTARP
jgi:6-phosphogluconolactonase